MAEEYSIKEQQEIAKHFIFVTPHGEIKDLVKDLKKIAPPNVVTNEWLKESMKEYSKRRFEIFEGDNSKIICSPQGEVQPNQYLHSDKKIYCTVDPVEQKIIKEEDASNKLPGGDNEKYRVSISKKLKEYLSSYYEDGSTPNTSARGTGMVYVSKEGKIAIVISFKNINTKNYWTGGWQSEWSLNISNQGKTKLTGRIRLIVHYYEDGNVQLNSKFEEFAEIDVSDPETTAKKTIDTIAQLESDFQTRLGKFYVQMNEHTFKGMRRKMPKTGVKMDWRKSVHALIQESAAK